ncbi:MAG: hypothetical protein HY681_04525 [Chloroflexi bacterium]|nr:hypothetical protein [Chloroflexota bacterium]
MVKYNDGPWDTVPGSAKYKSCRTPNPPCSSLSDTWEMAGLAPDLYRTEMFSFLWHDGSYDEDYHEKAFFVG